jgi:hypothetical protein
MKWLEDLRTFLEGKKTILTAVAYAIDSYGSQMGWWEPATFRSVLEQVMIIIFLRQGVQASGPVQPVK